MKVLKGDIKMKAIQIKNITKKYDDHIALNQVSFQFEFGKIYGFLGRNGAGKSTLMNLISNRILPNDGEILIDGETVKENMNVHDLIFCMSEVDLYEKRWKISDLFYWSKQFYKNFKIDKAYAYAKKFDLNTKCKFKELSKGYQSIVKLIIALSMDVSYLIFDEPVLGLDAYHRDLFYKELLVAYQKKQNTIIIATHLIEEVSNIIEEVVVIHKGSILLQDTTENLLNKGYTISGIAEDVDRFCKNKNVIGYDEVGSIKVAYILENEKLKENVEKLQISSLSLQKLFVKITEGRNV